MSISSLNQTSLVGLRYWEQVYGAAGVESPVLIALHWMTGDARSMQFLLKDYPHPMRYIALQGGYASGDRELGGYSWYPDEGAFYRRSEVEQLPAILNEVERLAVFVQQLKVLYTGKMAIAGMSQGGDLALALAVYNPELFDLVLPCAGRFFPPTTPELYPKAKSRLPRVVLYQGEADTTVPPHYASQAQAWLSAAGFDATLKLYPEVAHQITLPMVGDMQQTLITLHTAAPEKQS